MGSFQLRRGPSFLCGAVCRSGASTLRGLCDFASQEAKKILHKVSENEFNAIVADRRSKWVVGDEDLGYADSISSQSQLLKQVLAPEADGNCGRVVMLHLGETFLAFDLLVGA